jgi:hypothetical protein
MLSNIFLHHVLDKWFEDAVRPCMRGKATLVKIADDFVMTFETDHSARRVMAGRRRTARSNRSTSSASPIRGKSHGRARTWCGKQRPKAGLLAR